MDSSHGNGNHTLNLNDNTTVTCSLHFQKDTFLTLEVTTCDTDFWSFGSVYLFGLEVQKLVAVSPRHCYETTHLIIRDDDFLTTAGIGDIL